MYIDLTIEVTPELREEAFTNEKRTVGGHIGTHFDVMDKRFPLEYIKRKGIVFDVSNIKENEIRPSDIDLKRVNKDMFVAFYSNFLNRTGYGSKEYFKEHPELSKELIDKLLAKNISIIGIDFAGIRRPEEHSAMDQYCADQGVFIVENLNNLEKILENNKSGRFTAHTYPLKYTEMTGLPCRVVAEV